MSKRAGEFITVSDLLKEVNKDSIRFMMLNRSNDVELDFDFDKVLEKSKENPVFYVQYCNARINSLLKSINNEGLKKKINFKKTDFSLNKFEQEILRKIFEWPKVVKLSAINYEPHRIPFYLYDLSTLFHSYWSKGNTDSNYKFVKNGKIKKYKYFINNQNFKNCFNKRYENFRSFFTKINVMKKIFLSLSYYYLLFLFFYTVINFYFSNENYETLKENRTRDNEVFEKYLSNLPLIKNDTDNVIEYNSDTKKIMKIIKEDFGNYLKANEKKSSNNWSIRQISYKK